MRKLNFDWIAVALIPLTAVALFVRLRHLGAASFWFDEGVSVQLATMPWREVSKFLWHREANMLPYYLVLRGWIHLGHSETAVRSLSVLFGAATVPLLYFLARRIANRSAAIFAAALIAVNGFHVIYSQEARSYSMVVFLLTLSWLALARLVEEDKGRWRLIYLISSGLAIYAHFYTVLILASQWLAVRWFAPLDTVSRLRRVERITWVMAVPAIAYCLGHRGFLNWIPRPTVTALWDMAVVVCGYVPFLPIFFLLLIGVASWRFAITALKQGRSVEVWNAAAPLLWLLITPAVLIVISLAKPILVSRYLLLVLPALVIVAGSSLSSLGAKTGGVVTVALSVLLLHASLSNRLFPDHLVQDWREATLFVAKHSRPGDAAAFYLNIGRASFDWYWRMNGQRSELLFPGEEPQFTWKSFHTTPEVTTAATEKSAPDRVWLLLATGQSKLGDSDPLAVKVQKQIAAVNPYSCKRELTGVTILLYAREPEAAECAQNTPLNQQKFE